MGGPTKPDQLQINKTKKKAFIVEFSVPSDQFFDLCYQKKFNKDKELCSKGNELARISYQHRHIVLIIG